MQNGRREGDIENPWMTGSGVRCELNPNLPRALTVTAAMSSRYGRIPPFLSIAAALDSEAASQKVTGRAPDKQPGWRDPW
jgi:hypothetical protein